MILKLIVYGSSDLKAILVRYMIIKQNQMIGRMDRTNLFKRPCAAIRYRDLESRGGQGRLKTESIAAVLVNDKDFDLIDLRVTFCRIHLFMIRFIDHLKRQDEINGAAFLRYTFQPDAPAHNLHQVLGYA